VQHRQLVAQDGNLDVLVVGFKTETPDGERAVRRERRWWRPCRSSCQMPIVAAQSSDPVLAPFRDGL
jgi:hypothetical protein